MVKKLLNSALFRIWRIQISEGVFYRPVFDPQNSSYPTQPLSIPVIAKYHQDSKVESLSFHSHMQGWIQYFFLWGGAPVRNGVSDWWPDVNTSCIRKPQVISGRGLHTPCTLPLDPPLTWFIMSYIPIHIQAIPLITLSLFHLGDFWMPGKLKFNIKR